MAAFRPRSGQREILQYRGGRMGVAAVPGSGKTTAIAALAARLLALRAAGEGPLAGNGQVLVVTYQNAAADALRRRIAAMLAGQRLAAVGFDVRTLHSLAYGIVQTWPGHAGTTTDVRVLDEGAHRDAIDRAVVEWSARNPGVWGALAPGDSGYPGESWERRWAQIGAGLGRAVVSAAKNRRLRPEALTRLVQAAGAGGTGGDPSLEYLRIGSGIYERYQVLVETSGGLDFADMVRLAVDLLEGHPDLAARLNERWPVVLEDEAQDSVPLQEELLSRLTATSGHWVRVGDPNQSITSTFTAADPRFLRRFLERDDVRALEMAVSGRCAPRLMDLANGLVEWVCDAYPVAEVRAAAFRRQRMVPTDPDDPQQNPADGDCAVTFRTHDSRLDELVHVARRARRFAAARPDCTLAVLVPTNRLGYEQIEVLEQEGVTFDERLQSSRSSRTVIETLGRVLAFAADPLSPRALEGAFDVCAPAGDGPGAAQGGQLRALMRSCYRPESLVYPEPGVTTADAFPPVTGLAALDLSSVQDLARRARRWLEAARLPADQLALAVAQDLFEGDDLARAHQVAHFLRARADHNPTWRLPELTAELQRADVGRQLLAEEEGGFEPAAGRLTVTTMHKAKGLEWDLVYLVSVDGVEFPGSPDDRFRGHHEHLGGDPAQMARSRLASLVSGQECGEPSRAAQVDYIAERLRLLYVALTRARRFLSLNFSRTVPSGRRTRPVPEAIAFRRLQAMWARP